MSRVWFPCVRETVSSGDVYFHKQTHAYNLCDIIHLVVNSPSDFWLSPLHFPLPMERLAPILSSSPFSDRAALKLRVAWVSWNYSCEPLSPDNPGIYWDGGVVASLFPRRFVTGRFSPVPSCTFHRRKVGCILRAYLPSLKEELAS